MAALRQDVLRTAVERQHERGKVVPARKPCGVVGEIDRAGMIEMADGRAILPVHREGFASGFSHDGLFGADERAR